MSRKKSAFNQYARIGLATGPQTVASQEALRLFNHYKNISLNMYRWENLPEGIESRHIEEALFNRGQVFFVDDPMLGFIALPCSATSKLNVYGDPLSYVLFGHGYSKTFNAEDGVRILNNDTEIPTVCHIIHYAERMVRVDEIIQQNLKQQRFPFIVGVTKQNEFTMKNIMNQVGEGQEAIFVDKTLTEEGKLGIQAIQTNAPYLIDKLVQYRNELEKELLTFLGLNSTIQKKERLLVDETNANNSQIEMNLDLGYKQRKIACDLINEKFGLNIEVHKTLDIISPVITSTLNDYVLEEPIEGGDLNE